MYEIIAQTLGYFGLIFSVLSFQFNSGKKFFALHAMMKLSFFSNLLMLGGYSGSILNGIGFFNCAVYWFKEDGKTFAEKKFWAPLFSALYVIAGGAVVIMTRDAQELLPVIGSIASAVMFTFGSVKIYRLIQLFIVSPVWLAYHLFLGSQGGTICEIINVCSIVVALIRFRKPIEEMALRAAAKINLVLSVPEKRDDGYHEISTVMQTVGLYDKITVRLAENISVISEHSPCGEQNICYKAAEFFEEFGGAEIRIEKGIPLLSGLGGGSADGAAVLLALNKLYGNPFNNEQLIEKAMLLGSDVPFFLAGGTALIEGKGDKIAPCADYNAHIVLIKHGAKLSTGKMYGELDENGLADRREKVYAFCDSLKEGKTNRFFNDFETVFPCEDIKNALKICGATDACLSGSGPTVFGVFADEESAKKCAEKLKQGYDEVYYCKTVKSGVVFE